MADLEDNVRVFVDVVEGEVVEGVGDTRVIVLTQGGEDCAPVGRLLYVW